MDGNAAGMSSIKSGSFVLFETGRLQIEHRTVPAAERNQLVMTAQLDHFAVFENANAVGMANRGETMRDQNGGRVPRGGKDSFEDLGLAADVKLRGRLVEQH